MDSNSTLKVKSAALENIGIVALKESEKYWEIWPELGALSPPHAAQIPLAKKLGMILSGKLGVGIILRNVHKGHGFRYEDLDSNAAIDVSDKTIPLDKKLAYLWELQVALLKRENELRKAIGLPGSSISDRMMAYVGSNMCNIVGMAVMDRLQACVKLKNIEVIESPSKLRSGRVIRR